jgi:amino acid adenylation domain-containing protein
MRDLAARKNLHTPNAFAEFLAGECEQPIHRRFEQQAALRPDEVAIRMTSGDVIYAELNAAANRAARRLLQLVKDDAKPVALLLNQGYESILWTLAILKAGRCYAPLDQRLPELVLRRMVEHLDAGAVIAGAAYGDLAHALAAAKVSVVDADCDHANLSPANLDVNVAADALAYIFYTSGSTGDPKGVADCHRNVLHNVMRYTNNLKFAPGDVLSLVQNPSFSGTASSLFGALANGATIAAFDLQAEGLPALSAWIKQMRVTVFHAVPSIFRQLADPTTQFPDVRLVRLEGDRMSVRDFEHFRANFSNSCTLVNGFGATECGLVRQFFFAKDTTLNSDEVIPIGYDVPDVTVQIIDEGGAAQSPDTTGEIVVESEFLATGYWHNPALTEERFVASENGKRGYHTGDLGRMDKEGCLVHLGRVDQRIRIAGEFVDAGEVEAALLRIPGLSQCVVRDYVDESGERRLCAYVVASISHALTVTELRAAISYILAPHLVPTAFVFLDRLPLTKDLKIDHRQLPPPGRQRPPLASEYVAPQSPLEHQLALIWSEVLEIDQVGVTDSLFDLGGDSLHATRIVSRINSRHGLTVSITSLFELRTIRALTESLTSH